MEIKNTKVWCSLTKKAMRGVYARHKELGSIAHLTDHGGGSIRLTASVGDGEIEFMFQFESANDMRAIGKVFIAAADLRDAIAPPNAALTRRP